MQSHRELIRSHGFTLIELLVVLAILGMLASFAAPRLFNVLAGAESDSARVQLESLSVGVDLYRLETGSYPTNLLALVEKPAGATRWNGPYLKKNSLPKDPWGNDFVYRYPGEQGSYDLLTYGADGTEGGEGVDADVVSWE